MFTLTEKEITVFIKNLKSQINAVSRQNKSIQNFGSIAKDPTLWELEALLNYDFDYSENSQINSTDSISYNMNINSFNSIDYVELNNAYAYFSNQISQHLTTNTLERVKLIDISATENNSILKVKATIVYTTDNSTQRGTNPCDAITISGHWSASPSNTPSWPCSSVTNHGPDMCNTRLNCIVYNCTNLYYTNVITITLGINGGTTNPYYIKNPIDGTAPCNNEYLTASHLNTNVSLAQTHAIANKPSSPAGMQIINYRFYNMPGYPITNNYSIMAGYWQLGVTYGLPNCTSGGGGN